MVKQSLWMYSLKLLIAASIILPVGTGLFTGCQLILPTHLASDGTYFCIIEAVRLFFGTDCPEAHGS
jgi:hypothetical protein